jgi:hypothetical protein
MRERQEDRKMTVKAGDHASALTTADEQGRPAAGSHRPEALPRSITQARRSLRTSRASLAAAALLASAVVGQLLYPGAPAAAATGGKRTEIVPAASDGTANELNMTTVAQKGPLKVEARIKIPIAAGSNLIAAEAPDGAVFMAQVGQAIPSVVWVVDDDGPAAVAEHVSGPVQALAADSENLYVATYKMLIAFNRRTGNQVGAWALPKTYRANASDAQLVSVSGWNGQVLVLATLNNDVDIYRLSTASKAAPRLVAVSSSAAFGPDGSVYFARPDHHLSYMTAAGATTVGPKLAYRPNGLGGGVQFVDAVAGGLIWVTEPAGQGLDATFSSFNERTLKPVARWGMPIDGQLASTNAGTLVLGGDGFAGCPQGSQVATECVYRISSTGALSDATPVGPASLLLGPDPAITTTNASGTVTYLDRLA